MREFEGKVAVVTGGANGIGKCIAEAFRRNGAQVAVIDKAPGDHFVGDVADRRALEAFAEAVAREHGRVDCLVHNALPLMRGIDDCGYDDFQYALAVGVTAPFYLTKLLLPVLAPGAAIVNISSSRDRMSQPQTESYTAAKGGIAAQQSVGRVGRPEDIADAALFLCSKHAGFITGENLVIDGGMTHLMIYHGDNGWTLEPR